MTEVARAAGVSVSTVSHVVNGTRPDERPRHVSAGSPAACGDHAP
ncbi:LacI family DNA-binding transcriptional regulator [Kribbella sp. NPDC054772]